MFEYLKTWSESLITSSGLGAVFFLSAIESIFFPIPTALIITAATSMGADIATIVIVATIGSVTGAVVGYKLGMYGGRPFAEKFLKVSHIDSVESWFSRYGVLAVGIAGLTPLPYKVFAISAGIAKMHLPSFIAISIVSRFAQFIIFAYFGAALFR
ncbi:MAG: DedA family protein, partial [Candidatus Aenigmarchaeota archaeon]|nr:DedA family protein [Candidatus Aenigmarchaeota archaeon]